MRGIFVHNQVKELIHQGCQVVVVAPVRYLPSLPGRAARNDPKRAAWEGVQTYRPRYLLFPQARLFEYSGNFMHCGIRRTMELIYRKFPFDLFHAHVALPDGFAALKLKQRYGVPVVVTIHGADLHSTIYRNKRCKKAVGKVLEQADQIIMVSNKLKNIAADHYELRDSGKRITTIANGIIPLTFPGRKSNAGQTVILSVSNLIKSKGIDLNLQAFAALMDQHPHLIYKIIGDGPDMARLKHMVGALKIDENRVIFAGQLTHQAVMEQMSEADIFSLPSWKEGFGVAYIEAMSQGLPVIACKGEGIEDVIEHNINGFLVKPRDLNSLIETLDKLLTDPKRAASVGAVAKRTVLEKYRWANNAEKTISVYKQVLESRP